MPPIRGDKTPTKYPPTFGRLFLHCNTPYQVPMHEGGPLPCKVPSDPHIPHIPIRGDKTPTDSQPIFYRFPTNFGSLFLYPHTPRQPPIIRDYPLGCNPPSNTLISHTPIRGDKTPTDSPPIFYHFPANFWYLFLYSHTPHQSPIIGDCKLPSDPLIPHAPHPWG
jgi:hypothetical protein